MEAFFNSFLLVFISEMGDKTQLLSLLLAARYRKPWTILLGVLIATLANHALSSWAGGWLSEQLDPGVLKWILAGTFLAFAVWILVPDHQGELKAGRRFGVLVTTITAFFLAEMGDKTQLVTVALGARYSSPIIVTLGTTFGMIASNALAIFLGERLLRRIPMKWIHLFASLLFAAFAVGIILRF